MADPVAGRVVAFDEKQGTGEIETPDGARYAFHCTRIADGTRTVDVGAPVTFTVVPGLLGHWEATGIQKG